MNFELKLIMFVNFFFFLFFDIFKDIYSQIKARDLRKII
jgi:hypothetical protein